jgi:transcriptional regulator with XRE-family HTH domain
MNADQFLAPDFGPRLARLRATQQPPLSQNQLARRSGVSQPAVSEYERNHQLPTLVALEALAAGFGLSLEDFIRALRAQGGIHDRPTDQVS